MAPARAINDVRCLVVHIRGLSADGDLWALGLLESSRACKSKAMLGHMLVSLAFVTQEVGSTSTSNADRDVHDVHDVMTSVKRNWVDPSWLSQQNSFAVHTPLGHVRISRISFAIACAVCR